MSGEALKACPKCHATEGEAYANDGWFGVECQNCSKTTGLKFRSVAEAVAAWDGFARPPAGDDLVERLRTGVLHKMWDKGDGTLVSTGTADVAKANEAMDEAAARIIAVEAERDALGKQTGPDMWCMACGTVTRDSECDCTMYLELPEGEPNPQRLVNLANELGREGREAYIRAEAAEARIAVLEAALREALHFITNIDNAHPVVRQIRAALAPEPS